MGAIRRKAGALNVEEEFCAVDIEKHLRHAVHRRLAT